MGQEQLNKSQLPELSVKWLEGLERAVIQERAREREWKRNYSYMSYDEFVFRQSLQLAYNRGEMHKEEVMDALKNYKSNSKKVVVKDNP